jgi:hypothetical protein
MLVDSSLWLSSPLDFNDPFDMMAFVTVSGSAEDRKRRFRQIIRQQNMGLSWKKQNLMVGKMMAMSSEELLIAARDAHKGVVGSVGVCSFTTDPRSTLMWSHYASNHTGICVQFDVARDSRAFLEAVRVEYSAEYPVFNWLDGSSEQLRHVISRKHEAWRYECERRIVRIDSARTSLRVSRDALSGVVLGCRATKEVETMIIGLLKKRSNTGLATPRLYRARQHDTQYRVRLQQVRY